MKPAAPSFDLRGWVDEHRRAVIGGAIGVGVVAAVGVALAALDGPAAPAPPARPAARPAPRADALPACTGESLQAPAGAELAPSGDFFDAVCAGDALRLFSAGANGLSHAARGARRGAPFTEPLTIPTGGRTETGNAVSAAGHAWVAWRDAERFLAARADEAAAPPIAGAFASSWQGVWLLAANDRQAWLAATAAPAPGPAAYALRVSTAATPDTPRRFALGDGVIEAVIPGESASLLIRRSGGRRHEFTCITVTTAVLPVLAVAADAPAGAERVGVVPEVSLQRTAAFTVEADRVAVAQTGAGRVGEARSFLLTEGDGGPVTLLTFPPQGTPVAERLTAAGTGLGLGVNGRGEPVAVVAEGSQTLLFTRVAGEAPARERTPLEGVTRARVFACGEEPWLAYRAEGAAPRVAAVPLACLSRRAMPL